MPCLGWQPQENTHQNHVLLPHRRAGQGEMGSWVCCSLLPSLSWMCGTMMANTAAAFKAFHTAAACRSVVAFWCWPRSWRVHEPFREPSSHLYEQCKHSGLGQTVAELRMLQMSGCGLRGALHFRAPPAHGVQVSPSWVPSPAAEPWPCSALCSEPLETVEFEPILSRWATGSPTAPLTAPMDAPQAARPSSHPSLLQFLRSLLGYPRSLLGSQEPRAEQQEQGAAVGPRSWQAERVEPTRGGIPCQEHCKDEEGDSMELLLGELREVSLQGSLGSSTSRSCLTTSTSDVEAAAEDNGMEAPGGTVALQSSGAAGEEGVAADEAVSGRALEM